MRMQVKEGNGCFFWLDDVACFTQRSKETNVRWRLQQAPSYGCWWNCTDMWLHQNKNLSVEKNDRSADNLPSINWTLWAMTDRGITSLMLSGCSTCNEINSLTDVARFLRNMQSCTWWGSQFKHITEERDCLSRTVNYAGDFWRCEKLKKATWINSSLT